MATCTFNISGHFCARLTTRFMFSGSSRRFRNGRCRPPSHPLTRRCSNRARNVGPIKERLMRQQPNGIPPQNSACSAFRWSRYRSLLDVYDAACQARDDAEIVFGKNESHVSFHQLAERMLRVPGQVPTANCPVCRTCWHGWTSRSIPARLEDHGLQNVTEPLQPGSR